MMVIAIHQWKPENKLVFTAHIMCQFVLGAGFQEIVVERKWISESSGVFIQCKCEDLGHFEAF